MPNEDKDAAYLADMFRAGEAIGRFIHGRTFNELLNDEFFQAAVERKIEIIGEAARHVSEVCQTAHPEIEWRKIIAARHIFAHDYGELDYEVVWRVATIHVPMLVEQLRKISI